MIVLYEKKKIDEKQIGHNSGMIQLFPRLTKSIVW